MTLQGVRKLVTAGAAGTAMAVALMIGSGPATAHADVIDDLAHQFTTAQGAGPVSSLLYESLKLRAMGYKPTPGNYASINQALAITPNETPLIHALQNTVAQQTREQSQAAALAGNNNFTIGVNQYNPANPTTNGGLTIGSGGTVGGGSGNGGYTIGDGRSPGQTVGPATG